jgi:DNA-binding transcriptional LysR family regulator
LIHQPDAEPAELEIFRAVAPSKASRAARTLERAQSNVTTRISSWKAILAWRCFIATAAHDAHARGPRLLGYADHLLALAEEAASRCGRYPSGKPHRRMEARRPRACRAAGALSRRWPEVQVEIQTGTTAALVDAVLNHRIDCALVAHPGTAPRARLTWRTWDRDGRHVAVQ